jgi:hypothetical protein
MSVDDQFAAMSDPGFRAERSRVREELQELTEWYRRLNEEFDRRGTGRVGTGWLEGNRE